MNKAYFLISGFRTKGLTIYSQSRFPLYPFNRDIKIKITIKLEIRTANSFFDLRTPVAKHRSVYW